MEENSSSLPSNACRNCINIITNLLRFKKKIETTQETLTQLSSSFVILPMIDDLLEVSIKEEVADNNILDQKYCTPTGSSSQDDDCRESSSSQHPLGTPIETEVCSKSEDAFNVKSEHEMTLEDDQESVELEDNEEDYSDSETDESSDEEMPERTTRSGRVRVSPVISRRTKIPPLPKSDDEDEWEPRLESKLKKVSDKKKKKKEKVNGRKRTRKDWSLVPKKEANLKLEQLGLLQCTVCGESNKSFEDLSSHFARNHHIKRQDVRVMCCNTQFDRYSVYDHALYHNDNDAFKCADCGKQFVSDYARTKHLRRAHLPESKKLFQCGKCQKRFFVEDQLHRHEKKHESANWNCEICGFRE